MVFRSSCAHNYNLTVTRYEIFPIKPSTSKWNSCLRIFLNESINRPEVSDILFAYLLIILLILWVLMFLIFLYKFCFIDYTTHTHTKGERAVETNKCPNVRASTCAERTSIEGLPRCSLAGSWIWTRGINWKQGTLIRWCGHSKECLNFWAKFPSLNWCIFNWTALDFLP